MKRTFAIALLSALLLMAQKPVDVTVQQVNDRRSKGPFSGLHLRLEVPGIYARDVAAARVLVSTAVDDRGNNLVDSERGEPELTPAMLAQRDAKDSTPAVVSVDLKSPERKAAMVKEVSGEIELYMPSKDPNSIAEIAKFPSQSGKALSHRALKANGVDIAMLSAAQISAEKKKLVDAKRKEYAEAGIEGDTLTEYVKSYSDSLWTLEDGEVLLRVKDPSQRIEQIVYLDGSGELKFVSVRDDEGLTRLTIWGEKPQPDWKLRVSMKTSKNIVRHPFALKDVQLP